MPGRLCVTVCFLALLSFHGLYAQDEGDDYRDRNIQFEKERTSIPKATLKINLPVLLIDPKQAFYVATDTRITNFLSLDMGAGAYFNSWALSYYKGESFKGVRARLGLKYYYTFGRKLAPYIGVEGMFNRYKAKQYNDVCRAGCQYEETLLVTSETTARGFAVRTGLQLFLGADKRFFFDIYGGIGVKFTDRTEHLPPDAELLGVSENFFDFNREAGSYEDPNLILGIYFGYCFW